MPRTYHDIIATKDYTHRTRYKAVELEKGEVYSTHTNVAQNLVNRFDVAEYTGDSYELDTGEDDYTIKKVEDSEPEDGETLTDYVVEATVSEIKEHLGGLDEEMKDIDYDTKATYLKALKGAEVKNKDRKTVKQAVDNKLEALE